MTARERRADRVKIRTETQTKRWADEVRSARLNLGLSQAVVAKRAKVERAAWSRLERGKGRTLTFDLACRMAAAVGLDFVVNLYRSDTVLRDVAHVRLLTDLQVLLGDGWTWRYEVPIGLPPEQRAWDAVATHRVTGLSIRVEAETRLRDAQATLRRIESKRILDDEPRLILAVRDSRNNRDAVVDAEKILSSAFPADRRHALAQLRAGEDPGADLLVMVDWVRAPAKDAQPA